MTEWTKFLDEWSVGTVPAEEQEINSAESRVGLKFSKEYRNFLEVTNGMLAHGYVTLFSTDEISERNETNEISTTFPEWIMIGDDGGNGGILIPVGGEAGPVYLVDMGSVVFDEEYRLDASFSSWLRRRCPMLK